MKSVTGDRVPEADCNNGKPYAISDTFEETKNETFGAQYGAGRASGLLGYENVTIGGIHVPRQKGWSGQRNYIQSGDGCISGIAAALPAGDVPTLWLLGDPFLKNVVAVFDLEHEEMIFAART